jgi:hypothetical protein
MIWQAPTHIYALPGVNTVAQLGAPLYDAGARLPRVRSRYRQTVRQPAFPLYEAGAWRLHGLGQSATGAGAKILAASAPVAALATSTLSAAALGSWAGPLGAGVGVLVGVLAGLWAAHSARVAGAKHENQAINSAVNTWDAGMKAIFAAANSSDPAINVSGAQAAGQVQELWGQFWAQMSPLIGAPGTADSSARGSNCGSTNLNPAGPCAGTPQGHKCDNSCTATCCVACQDLYPSMLQALEVLNSPSGGTVQVCAIAGSKYGAQARSGYTLSYTPPISSGAGASIGADLSSIFGGGGPSATAAGGNLLPVLALGALAFFLFS